MTDASIDHLVVWASDLREGADWCRRTLGVDPAQGGEHPLMGTHNLLLDLSSPAHPRSYLEIIAIKSRAISARPMGAKRWFDMDDPALRAQVARGGPRLIHWVARVPDIAASHAALAARGVERGEIITASRPSPLGLLEWRITVREDGRRLMDGCLPTLIEWGERHPCQGLPDSGVQLRSLRLQHPQADALAHACADAGLRQLPVERAGAPRLAATLHTPLGPVDIASQPPE